MSHPVPKIGRVLIVSYYWPPSGGSGVQRWLKMAKYLPNFGWEPVMVVPAEADYAQTDLSLQADINPNLEILSYPIWEPYSLYRKFTGAGATKQLPGASAKAQQNTSKNFSLTQRFGRWLRANFFIPDPKVLWVRPTVKSLSAYLLAHPVDAVITTGPPHSVHLIGRELKKRMPTLPWLMDIRDPWSQFDVHLAFGPSRRAVEKNRRLELSCLRAADLVLATSFSMPSHLEAFDLGKFVTLTNGFDADDFAFTKTLQREALSGVSKFHIYHTGLLTANRNPAALWKALASISSRDQSFAEKLHIYLIGQVDSAISDHLAALPALAGKWTIHPWMPHAELLTRYEDAKLFLLCPNQSDNARGQINGKLFEYLAMGTPVLHFGPFDADNTRILDEAHAGLTVPPGDVDAAEAAIMNIYTGKFASSPQAFRTEVIAHYERREIAGKLSSLLAQLVPK